MSSRPRVHLLCGLNGAGKTTYARRLAETLPGVRFSLDEWMLRSYPLLCFDDPDYPPLAEACKELIWDTACQVLRCGVDVILDWNQWSRERRSTWRTRAEGAGSRPVLHHLRVPVEVAVARGLARPARGPDTSHRLTADEMRHLAAIFEHPTADEGIEIIEILA
ncbi:MAG TPA: ATP-binding protein [Micromonosporaceae bacterium]|nr:ATP-binding protein [Micromonosporaceae bacterium]